MGSRHYVAFGNFNRNPIGQISLVDTLFGVVSLLSFAALLLSIFRRRRMSFLIGILSILFLSIYIYSAIIGYGELYSFSGDLGDFVKNSLPIILLLYMGPMLVCSGVAAFEFAHYLRRGPD